MKRGALAIKLMILSGFNIGDTMDNV